MMRFDFDDNGVRKAFCAKKGRHIRGLYDFAIRSLRDTIDERYCMIIHAQNPEGATALRDMLRDAVPNLAISADVETNRMGQATGVHLGYSAIGLAFLRKKGTFENAELHRKIQIPDDSIYGYQAIWI